MVNKKLASVIDSLWNDVTKPQRDILMKSWAHLKNHEDGTTRIDRVASVIMELFPVHDIDIIDEYILWDVND